MPYRPTNFRLTVVKLYYIIFFPEIFQKEEKEKIENIESSDDDKDEPIDTEE
jgi:hypothetical protein